MIQTQDLRAPCLQARALDLKSSRMEIAEQKACARRVANMCCASVAKGVHGLVKAQYQVHPAAV